MMTTDPQEQLTNGPVGPGASAHPLWARRSAPAGWTLAARGVGVLFAAAAVGNAVGTVPDATSFLVWCRDGAWLPPFSALLDRLVPIAPLVVAATAACEAGLAYLLLRGRHVRASLRLAQLFVLGLIPCLAWPYWTVNVVLAALFELVHRHVDRDLG